MIEIDPQQELFTELLIQIKRLGYDVYDGALPLDNAPYPFVYLADSQLIDDTNKSAIFGTVNQTIHVWSNKPNHRGDVSAMLYAIKAVCRRLEHTSNFAWFLSNTTQRILSDTTTKQPLLHGIVEVEYKFS